MSQQDRLVTALKRRWMTSGDIVGLLGSVCPHKRISELKQAGVVINKRPSSNPSFKFEYRAA